MRKLFPVALTICIAGVAIRAADWPSPSGNPQRDGWAKSEKAFTPENAKKLELLYKYKADNQARGIDALTAPMINGMLITYLGFKEMLVFGGSGDNVYSVDADLNRIIWKTHFDYKGDKRQAAPTATCPGGLTTSVAMPGSSAAAGRGGGGRGAPGRGAPGRGAVPPPAPRVGRGGLFATGFGRSSVFLVVSSDGYLHALNSSTGGDKAPAVQFVPANSKLSALNINDGVIYASTLDNCGGEGNALYALDMGAEEPKLTSFPTNGRGAEGTAGTAITNEGTVFAQFADGHGESGPYNDTVVAFTKDLKPKDYFTPPDAKGAASGAGATPVVFSWKDKEVVAAGSRNGRLYLLDAMSPGGADHHTPLAQSEPVKGQFHGAFSSWEDTDSKTRWIYASVWNGSHGNIVGFKVEDHNGTPALVQAWTSKDIVSPAPTVTANGLVFALSTSESPEGKPSGHAILYALDGNTGKELYSSGNAISTYAYNSGLAVANRRIYLTAHDNMVYCFGFMADQPQLTGK